MTGLLPLSLPSWLLTGTLNFVVLSSKFTAAERNNMSGTSMVIVDLWFVMVDVFVIFGSPGVQHVLIFTWTQGERQEGVRALYAEQVQTSRIQTAGVTDIREAHLYI